jgi:hypothetical protein
MPFPDFAALSPGYDSAGDDCSNGMMVRMATGPDSLPACRHDAGVRRRHSFKF